MAVNVRIGIRACPDAVSRINGRDDDKSEFVGGCLPGHGRYRAIAMRRDDRGGRDNSRSRFDDNRRCYHHWSWSNDDRYRNRPCGGHNDDLRGDMEQRTGCFHRADYDAFDSSKGKSHDCTSR